MPARDSPWTQFATYDSSRLTSQKLGASENCETRISILAAVRYTWSYDLFVKDLASRAYNDTSAKQVPPPASLSVGKNASQPKDEQMYSPLRAI